MNRMNRRFLALLASTALALAGCGDTHDSLTSDSIRTLNETADVLATVKDARSADAARPQLKKLGERWRGLQKRAGDLKQPTTEEREELQKKHRPELEAAIKRYFTETTRVLRVPGGAGALQELGDVKPQETSKKR
jgi:hypothetical protein